MKTKALFKLSIAVVLPFFMLTQGCKKEDNYKSATVNVTLTHNVDGENLTFDNYAYTNPFGKKYKVTKLHYYVSDFKFNKSDGSSFEVNKVQYVDARDASTMKFTLTGVEGGDYSSISFVFGLNEAQNVDNSLPATLENQSMIWPDPLGGGYHYMQQEGFYIDGTDTVPFNTHMGLKNVGGNTFEQNFVTVELGSNSGIMIDGKNWDIEIAMNLNEWYKNPTNYDFPDYGQAIMANPDAQQTLHDNCSTVFSLVDKSEE